MHSIQMSTIVKILLFLPFLTGMCSSSSHPYQKWCEQAFRADSGFVNSTQALQLLQLICQNDTALFGSQYCASQKGALSVVNLSQSDSSGKYYLGREINGERQWVLCTTINMVMDGMPFVLEFTERQGAFTLNGYRQYYHGNYACCWQGHWEEFAKMGPYFYVETCGTGSGFCAASANFLTFPLSPNTDNEAPSPSITLRSFQAYPLREVLQGKMNMRGDTIVVDYTYQVDSFIENAAKEMVPHSLYDTRFTALFGFDPAQQKFSLLNREAVLREKRLEYLFEDY